MQHLSTNTYYNASALTTRRCHWQTWFEVANFKLSTCWRNFIINRPPSPARLSARFQLLILHFEQDNRKTIVVYRHRPLNQHRTVRLLCHGRTWRRNSLHCSTHHIILQSSNLHHRILIYLSAMMVWQSTQCKKHPHAYKFKAVSSQCTSYWTVNYRWQSYSVNQTMDTTKNKLWKATTFVHKLGSTRQCVKLTKQCLCIVQWL